MTVTIHKSRLPEIAELKGKANEASWDGCRAGAIRFAGFVGVHVGGQMYQGELRFEPSDPNDERADFSPLREQGDGDAD